MLLTVHTLTGALLGMPLRRRPAMAFAVGVASHIAMDALPHWGAGGDDERWLQVARRDGLTSLAALTAIAALTPGAARAGVIAGSLGAIAPDLRSPLQRSVGVQPYPEPFDELHTQVQQGKESPRRMPQALTVAGVLAVAVATAIRWLRRSG